MIAAKQVTASRALGARSDELLQAAIDAPTAKLVKKLGQTRFENVGKWDAVKVDAMLMVLRAKFTDDRLQQLLTPRWLNPPITIASGETGAPARNGATCWAGV